MRNMNIFFWSKSIMTIAIILGYSCSSTAQDWKEDYSSSKGVIQITGIWNDTAIVAISNELIVIINYETAEFRLKLDKSTLRTGIDSLDKKLQGVVRDYIEFEGKLKIERVNSQQHPPQDFEVRGKLLNPIQNKFIVGMGHLEHTFGEIYSSVLNMTFHFNLSDTNLVIDLPSLYDEIHVEIINAVLKKGGVR